jgi:hypothetical protein
LTTSPQFTPFCPSARTLHRWWSSPRHHESFDLRMTGGKAYYSLTFRLAPKPPQSANPNASW